ncbi:MAG: anti-anti-sigma factor [Oleiphilus sp.]|nr:MAG: anti-anti-sigma factor [Oleiphilus sp.]
MSVCKILLAESSGVYILKLVGEVRLNFCSTIDASIESIVTDPNFMSLVVDLSETSLIDSTTLGLLAKLAIRAKAKSHFLPSVVSTNPDITRILLAMGFDSFYIVVKEPALTNEQLQEITPQDVSEAELREHVLDAHKVLMDMNEHNRDQFKDLVSALELDMREGVSSQAS